MERRTTDFLKILSRTRQKEPQFSVAFRFWTKSSSFVKVTYKRGLENIRIFKLIYFKILDIQIILTYRVDQVDFDQEAIPIGGRGEGLQKQVNTIMICEI